MLWGTCTFIVLWNCFYWSIWYHHSIVIKVLACEQQILGSNQNEAFIQIYGIKFLKIMGFFPSKLLIFCLWLTYFLCIMLSVIIKSGFFIDLRNYSMVLWATLFMHIYDSQKGIYVVLFTISNNINQIKNVMKDYMTIII